MKQWVSVGLAAVLTLALTAPAFGGTQAADAAATGTYTINFKGQLPADADLIIRQAGGRIIQADKELSYVQAASDAPDFLDKIRQNANVENAGRTLKIIQEEAVERMEFDGSDHAMYDQYQWDIKQVTENGASWNLPGGKGNKNIVVAVIDTGIDLEHPDLKDNIVDAKSFVPGEGPQDVDGHGSHVAGTIAAHGKALGIGPELGIAALKVFPANGEATTASIAEALKYAADMDYDVVNMSLGSYVYLQDQAYDTNDLRADMNLFKKAIAYAVRKGVTVVGSAGNAGADISSPGNLTKYFDNPNIVGDEHGATHRDPSSDLLIRVSAGNKNKQLTFYSNYGAGKIDVMAPGGDLGPGYPATRDRTWLCLSTVPIVDESLNVVGHGYAFYGGTSMAAPKVSGLAGVIIARHGKNVLSPAQVKSIIQQSAEDIYKPGYDEQSGFGLVNAVNALNR